MAEKPDTEKQRQLDKKERHAAMYGQGVEALRAGLKNVRRTTTRRLDDAGMPEDMQGNDGRDW